MHDWDLPTYCCAHGRLIGHAPVGLARALKESALTNKVHAKRSNYHKPWQHMAKNFHAVHLVDLATQRTGSADSAPACLEANTVGGMLSRTSSAESVSSVRSNNTAPPMMSPHKDALNAKRTSSTGNARI